jgi:hypothetical protein
MKTDILKNGATKKGVENFYLSNGTNESISNFRETSGIQRLMIFSILLLIYHISQVKEAD